MAGKRAAELAEKRRTWQEHLKKWDSSGLSQVEYCRRNNLRTNIFLYWKKKLLPESTPALVELPAKLFSRPALPQKAPLCLFVDGRYRIDIAPGFDVDTLDRLIRMLSGL